MRKQQLPVAEDLLEKKKHNKSQKTKAMDYDFKTKLASERQKVEEEFDYEGKTFRMKTHLESGINQKREEEGFDDFSLFDQRGLQYMRLRLQGQTRLVTFSVNTPCPGYQGGRIIKAMSMKGQTH